MSTTQAPNAPNETDQENPGAERPRWQPDDPVIAGYIARRLLRRDLRPGDMAEVRRMDTGHPTSPIYWDTMLRYGITSTESADNDDAGLEECWAHIMKMIAHGTKVGQEETTGPHNGSVPLGRALATAGYHELRLSTLLNADTGQIHRLLAQATAFLDQKGMTYNVEDMARLALTARRSESQRSADRNYIARHYHRASYRMHREDDDG